MEVQSVELLKTQLPLDQKQFEYHLDLLFDETTPTALCPTIAKLLMNTSARGKYDLKSCDEFVHSFCTTTKRNVTELSQEEVVTFQRYLWQFYSNILVDRPTLQSTSWNNELFISLVLSHLRDASNKGVVNAICCATLTSHKNNPRIFELSLSNTHRITLIESLLQAIADGSPFALSCIQSFVESAPNVILQCYNEINQDSKSIFLDVIAELGENPSHAVATFLASTFKEKSRRLLTTAVSRLEPGSSDAIETSKLITCLCIVSSAEGSQHQMSLQKDKSLLIDTVYLLKMIHQLGRRENGSAWAPIVKISEVNFEDGSHPAHGFKRDLVRLIANLIYNNKENQDLMRETEGLQVLLDCSQIDAKNPFITQWVLFAVRNCCIDNTENQEILRSMDAIGSINKSLLVEAGVLADE